MSSGFITEGFAKKYLNINGKFEDHILFAKLKKKN
jgi:RimJ/RimL family protein N-acetyltransferase